MSYHRVNKKNTFLNAFFWLAIAGLILVIFIFTPVFPLLSGSFHKTGTNLWGAKETLSDGIKTTSSLIVQSKKSLMDENQALSDEIEFYKGKLLTLNQVQSENEELRSMLHVVDMRSSFITARVLSRPEQSLYNLLIIDGGVEAGLAVGDTVTAFGTVLLGKIIEVSKKTAKVQLYSSPGVETQAIIISDNLVLPIRGHGAGNFRLELPRDIETEIGTQVLDNKTQKILGTIQASIFDPREPFQTILVRSPVNIHHLMWVQVMKTQ